MHHFTIIKTPYLMFKFIKTFHKFWVTISFVFYYVSMTSIVKKISNFYVYTKT